MKNFNRPAQFPWSWLKSPRSNELAQHAHTWIHSRPSDINTVTTRTLCEAPAHLLHNLESTGISTVAAANKKQE